MTNDKAAASENTHDDEKSGPGTVPARDRLALTACIFCTVAAFGFLEPFVPLYLEQSGLTRAQIGIVAAAGSGSGMLVQPLLGRLSDRIDARRPLMLAAALVAVCAYSGYRYASGVFGFALLTALGMNSVMYLNTAAAVLVGRRTAAGGGGAGTFAAYRVWGCVGYVVVSLLVGLLLGRGTGGDGGLTRASLGPLFAYGPWLFGLVALAALFVPDPKRADLPRSAPVAPDPRGSVSMPAEETPAPPVVADGADCPPTTDPEARASRGASNLTRYLRAHFLYLFAWCGAASYLGLFLKGMGATPLWITTVFATGVLCEAAVMLIAGRLSDRFGRRPLLTVAYVTMPLRLLLYAPAVAPGWVLGVQTLHGLNFGILGAVAIALVNDLCPEHERGAAQARLAAAGGLAAALGPAVGGGIAQRFGIPANFCAMAAVAAVGAAVLLWRVRETLPAPHESLRRRGPAWLRPTLAVMSVPAGRLRAWRAARAGGAQKGSGL